MLIGHQKLQYQDYNHCSKSFPETEGVVLMGTMHIDSISFLQDQESLLVCLLVRAYINMPTECILQFYLNGNLACQHLWLYIFYKGIR